MTWRGMNDLQNVPGEHTEKILNTACIIYDARRVMIVDFWVMKPRNLVCSYQYASVTAVFTFRVYVFLP
jgi:hypothetical protein